MPTQEIFERCIRFVNELEGQESELDIAVQVGQPLKTGDLDLLVIRKLKLAIDMVKTQAVSSQHSQLLYYLACYANAIGKPRLGIPLCYITINQPTTSERYRLLAKDLLNEIKLKLPDDLYYEEMQKTTLNISAALDDSRKWLTHQEKHASQPPTKPIFNSDFLKKQLNKNAKK